MYGDVRDHVTFGTFLAAEIHFCENVQLFMKSQMVSIVMFSLVWAFSSMFLVLFLCLEIYLDIGFDCVIN